VYNAESPAVIQQKAIAAKALMEAGYTPEEAQQRVGLEKHALPEPAPQSGVRVLPEAREEDAPEPSYSEKLAADMTAKNRTECPHGETRACRSCRVALRYETTDDGYKPVWQSFARRAA
jgi:23S rRNA C2498 (ribose-2'-O)-methylase RlmM